MDLIVLIICCVGALLCAATIFGADAQAALNVNVATTTETLLVVGNAVTLPSGNGKAVVRGFVQLTVGASTTAVTLTIYRGTAIGGPIVGQQNPYAGNFAAGSTAAFAVQFVDMLSNVSGAQYCMSVKQTGATGNGTVLNATLDTTVLSG